jgi:hypothetical protein
LDLFSERQQPLFAIFIHTSKIQVKKHRVKQNEIKLKNGLVYQDNGFIFAREDGHPQLRKVVETRLKRLLKKVGIEKNITPLAINFFKGFINLT